MQKITKDGRARGGSKKRVTLLFNLRDRFMGGLYGCEDSLTGSTLTLEKKGSNGTRKAIQF